MKKIIVSLILFLFVLCFQAYGQRKCGSTLNLTQIQKTDPDRYKQIMDLENRIQKAMKYPKLSSTQQPTIYIPVVVHVVYKNGVQNISDKQIKSQIDVLNKDFRRLNEDKVNTPKAFAEVAEDANIEFFLAKKDDSGKSTTGITRTSTLKDVFYMKGDDVKFGSKGGKNAWNPNIYLNIWVCNLGDDLLGYAQFPDLSNTSTDGVVINYKAFGTNGTAEAPYNKGRTTTHEIGHWLGLRHIWGDDDPNDDGGCHCDGTDEMLDTPNQSVATKGSPSFPQYDCCSKFSPGIMFMNYMDYTDDASMNMFTNDQIGRMRSILMIQKSSLALYSHCYNGIRDGDETGIDCGGSCPRCIIEATCYDGIKNQNETGIDCGGVCAECIPETCNDGFKNQNETGIDCGGVCLPCGIGGNLDDLVTTGDCECGDAGILQVNNSNSLFSGKNIFDAGNIKLSHGEYNDIFVQMKDGSNLYRCRNKTYRNQQYSFLRNGGIFFEENNVKFSPDKMYKLTFNYWKYTGFFSVPQPRIRGPVHLRLANGLVNTATKSKYFVEKSFIKHEGYFWKSPISTMPKIKETFYIGYVYDIKDKIGCEYYDDDDEQRYYEVSIIFKPDNYYSQLWITTENQDPILNSSWVYPTINSVKIEEVCEQNFVLNENTQNVYNSIRAENMITLANFKYEPTKEVNLIAGKTITIKENTKITSKNGGSVRMHIDPNVCSSSTPRLGELTDDSFSEIPSSTLLNNPEMSQSSEIIVYPNPTSGLVNLKTSNSDIIIFEVQVYSMSGQLVRAKSSILNPYSFQLSNLPKGMYLLKVGSSIGITNHRIILE